ncbi:hypothetical protein Dimus_020612 [Dionaea muscipula]
MLSSTHEREKRIHTGLLDLGWMGSRICMNSYCSTTVTKQWKQGWKLKSGQVSDLCYNCGSAYENSLYCDTFHSEESGWRECSLCNKRLHCGCSASVPFLEIQDFGGIWCVSCARSAGCHSVQTDGISHEAQPSITHATSGTQNIQANSELDADTPEKLNLLRLGRIMKADESRCLPPPQADKDGAFGPISGGDIMHSVGFGCLGFQNLSGPPSTPPKCPKSNENKQNVGVKDVLDSGGHPNLNISLYAPSETPNFDLAHADRVDEKEKIKQSLFQSTTRPRHILPKPPKNGYTKISDTTKGSMSHVRAARPPAEGRLRNQLLPRYWPRITEQELQQISGDLNSTIVPLFEKVLSASDASRIGRLVLPKACAEAYFPSINQSEGLPLKIQDVKGNEWTFQFRFWPNNNSRMYVLEGVTPCIQSMQLQAGDTVTFSRIDPGGRLVIGFRKVSIAAEAQDPSTSASPYGNACWESLNSDPTSSIPTVNGFSHFHDSLKGSTDHLNALPKQSKVVEEGPHWNKSEKFKQKVDEDFWPEAAVGSGKKARNVGSKSKRLLMHSEDALELKLTWEETQDMLRPPPSVQPNIVMIEEFELEEYNEPPVFGKKAFFMTRFTGGQEQWTRCDKCSKWRRLPVDVLLPPKWTCSDNVWDKSRSSCSAPDEMSSNELDNVYGPNRDLKRRKALESPEVDPGCQPSGLDALATAAALGEHGHEHELMEEPSTGGGATTRHPRHRPGCTCIVCIQPPSGQGKHDPSCVCNVCSTVKRRFKTLMMRKKKRQCERTQAETLQKHPQNRHEQLLCQSNKTNSRKEFVSQTMGKSQAEEAGESGKGGIDLNSHPTREEDSHAEAEVEVPSCGTSIPLEMCMKQNGLACLIYDNEKDKDSLHSIPCMHMQDANNGENQEECIVSADVDRKEKPMHEDGEEHEHDHDHADGHKDTTAPLPD